MDTIRSFKGYGKVDPAEEQAFRRKTRKRIIILTVSVVLLLAVIIGAVAGTLIHKRNNDNDSSVEGSNAAAQSIKAVCSQTLYPESCYNSISELDKNGTSDPEELLKFSLQVVYNALSEVSSLPESLGKTTTDEKVKKALNVCQTVLDDAVDYLQDSISAMDVKSGEKLLTGAKIDDLKTWLSTAITNQETCLDALDEMNSTFLAETKSRMQNSTEYASNSLAIVSKISGILGRLNLPIHRKLLSEPETGYPEWMSAGVRKLLQTTTKPTPNVTVAGDGTGDVRTINEAMAKVTKKSKSVFIIYIKAGTYKENVVLDKSFWNVMIYGDGKDKSIVSGDLNFVDGTPTFSTATFAVAGKGFVAIDMGFKNTAGAAKHQAVALRSGSDFSVFYRCSFDAFQDTLYSHSNRQFYRECDITGTIDFIFGNAAVVYQKCKIMPRQPLSNQFVTITAQGKKDPNQNTGISIQNCDISPLDKLTAATYLGRPWKDFSTTVIMKSTIGGFLNPLGWISWVQGVDPPASIFYGEYMNTGLGAGVGNRVKWAGYKPSLTSTDAGRFTVESFIEGSVWLPQTKVLYDSKL